MSWCLLQAYDYVNRFCPGRNKFFGRGTRIIFKAQAKPDVSPIHSPFMYTEYKTLPADGVEHDFRGFTADEVRVELLAVSVGVHPSGDYFDVYDHQPLPRDIGLFGMVVAQTPYFDSTDREVWDDDTRYAWIPLTRRMAIWATKWST